MCGFLPPREACVAVHNPSRESVSCTSRKVRYAKTACDALSSSVQPTSPTLRTNIKPARFQACTYNKITRNMCPDIGNLQLHGGARTMAKMKTCHLVARLTVKPSPRQSLRMPRPKHLSRRCRLVCGMCRIHLPVLVVPSPTHVTVATPVTPKSLQTTWRSPSVANCATTYPYQ